MTMSKASATVLDHAWGSPLLGGLISEAFRSEDKPILEKQQRVIGQADLWSLKPVLLNIDTGAVKVRRLLAKMIEAEQTRPAFAAETSSPRV
jgi:hypothetical protein